MFGAVASICADAHAARRFDDDALIRMQRPSAARLRQLSRWGISPWLDHPRGEQWVLHVPGAARAQLDATGWDYEVVVADLHAELERAHAIAVPPTQGLPADFFADFRDLATIELQLDAWIAEQPDRVTGIEVGTSYEGRTIRAIRISDAPDDAPVVLVNGTQHAREWIGTMATMYIADTLVHADDDPVWLAAVSQLAFVIVPVANPDGFVHTWAEDRLWRKNRSAPYGVDLNRNWTVAWGGEGASLNPLSNNYRGEGPLSEPETAALAALVDDLDVVAHLDVHSFGQLVLSPWSWVLDPPPAIDDLEPLGTAMADAMGAAYGEDYVAIRAAQLYAAAGTMPDYLYGTQGARAFTLELRPDDAEPHDAGFVLGAADIVPTAEEALAAMLTLVDVAADARPLPPGDDGNAPPPLDDTTGSTSHSFDVTTSTGEAGTTSGGEVVGASSSGEMPDGSTGPAPDATQVDDVSSSCACRTTGPRGEPGAVALLLALLLRRRRDD